MSNILDYFSYGLSFFAAFFVVTNPLGTVPIFIGLTSNLYRRDTNRVNLVVCITTVIIIAISLSIGNYILNFFGVTIDAFRIAGGIMISRLAFSMLTGTVAQERQNKQEKEELDQSSIASAPGFKAASIAVVPLGIPIMAGPATISTAILWGREITQVGQVLAIACALAVYFVTVYVLFYVSPFINRVLGNTGLNVLTRVIGLFMLALACQFIINAITNIADHYMNMHPTLNATK